MPKVVLASALARWLPQGDGGEVALELAGTRLDEILDALFARHPALRGYVLDEHGTIRHHVAIFVDGDVVRDKANLTRALGARAEVYVMQALSGG